MYQFSSAALFIHTLQIMKNVVSTDTYCCKVSMLKRGGFNSDNALEYVLVLACSQVGT